MLRNLNVAIAGKKIPTDFFVINASDDEHEGIILGKPFLKLVNVVLNVAIASEGRAFNGAMRS